MAFVRRVIGGQLAHLQLDAPQRFLGGRVVNGRDGRHLVRPGSARARAPTDTRCAQSAARQKPLSQSAPVTIAFTPGSFTASEISTSRISACE